MASTISKEAADIAAKTFSITANNSGEINVKNKRFIVIGTDGFPYGFGDELSLRPFLFREGMKSGKSIVELIKDVKNQGKVESNVENTLSILSYAGYGLFELVSETNNEIIIRLHNSFEVDSYKRNFNKPATQPVCHFTRGILSEVFSALKEKPVNVEETTCAAMGGSYCEFKITVIEG